MNYQLISAIVLSASVLFASCKKEKDNNTPQPTTTNNSSLLKVGNYWVFETTFVNGNDSSVSNLPDTDSTYIEKDTIINNIKWYKQVSVGYSTNTPGGDFKYVTLWRDSVGVLVNNYGSKPGGWYKDPGVVKKFLSMNGTDTSFEALTVLQPNDSIVTFPSGTLKAKIIKTTYKMHLSPGNIIYRDVLRLVSEDFYLNLLETTIIFGPVVPSFYEKRLVRYHIAK